MDLITDAGIKKKSFELYFNGGSIWCEHLDGMGGSKDKVTEKFLSDSKIFSKPSVTSYMIINIDKTTIDDEIISCIVNGIISSHKHFMKISFVGVKKRRDRVAFREIQNITGCLVSFFDDFEKAKQCTLPEKTIDTGHSII